MPILNSQTARDFIRLALNEAQILGVGQTALAQDTNDCFTLLQRMTNMWQRRRWMVPSLTDILTLGNGAISNTVGPGGYWNITPRPRAFRAGYFVQNTQSGVSVSLPLSPVFSYEDYARITVKPLATFPEAFFYDNQNNTTVSGAIPPVVTSLGNLFIWPIPDATYTIHMICESDLGWPNTLDSVFTMPEEYAEAVHYNLALRICSMYQVDPKPSTGGLAKVALNTIKMNNTQIPEMQMPPGLRQGKAFSLWNPDGF